MNVTHCHPERRVRAGGKRRTPFESIEIHTKGILRRYAPQDDMPGAMRNLRLLGLLKMT